MSPVHPAPSQLADLAAVMRPDWDRADLEGAVAQARSFGWSWPKVFGEVARLLTDESSSPRDLHVAARNPVERAQPSPHYREWAQACREAVAATRKATA
jgi:hypothetical protein